MTHIILYCEDLQCSNSKATELKTASSNNAENSRIKSEPTTSNHIYDLNISKDVRDVFFCLIDYSIGAGNRRFNRWMNSRTQGQSLWSDESLRNSLLSYIGAIYGQRDRRFRVLDSLRIPYNGSDELDQLYAIIQKFEQQSG